MGSQDGQVAKGIAFRAKVKLSLYRPRWALRAPGGSGSQDFKNRRMKVVSFSAVCTGRLYPHKRSLALIFVRG